MNEIKRRSHIRPAAAHTRRRTMSSDIEIKAVTARDVTSETAEACAALFSDNYGTWPNGRRIRMSSSRLRLDYLYDPNACTMVVAFEDREIVGYACVSDIRGLAGRLPVPGRWVTQLVVRESHRRQGIATRLCRTALHLANVQKTNLNANSNEYSVVHPSMYGILCGIASSNPYAIRALERASGSSCSPVATRSLFPVLSQFEKMPGYLRSARLDPDRRQCQVHTGFDIFHGDFVQRSLVHLRKQGKWSNGSTRLAPGHEFVAVMMY